MSRLANTVRSFLPLGQVQGRVSLKCVDLWFVLVDGGRCVAQNFIETCEVFSQIARMLWACRVMIVLSDLCERLLG